MSKLAFHVSNCKVDVNVSGILIRESVPGSATLVFVHLETIQMNDQRIEEEGAAKDLQPFEKQREHRSLETEACLRSACKHLLTCSESINIEPFALQTRAAVT